MQSLTKPLHNKTNVYLILDDEKESSVCSHLSKVSPFYIVGKTSRPEVLFDLVRKLGKQLQVILWQLSSRPFEELIGHIHKFNIAYPSTGLVIVTKGENPKELHGLLRLGVPGIVSCQEGPQQLQLCVQSVANGAVYHGPCVRRLLASKQRNLAEWDSFTRTERRIIPLLAAGLPDKAIQEQLCIASSTLDNHRTSIYSKLREFGHEVFSKAELVIWYQNTGL
jgi:DNA-binding NarL/FixJ family response regulator